MNFSKEKTAAVKGFAVIAMLFHHCFHSASIYGGYDVSFAPFPEQLVNNVAVFFKLCVGTFAFLSGYGLSVKWAEIRDSEIGRKKYFSSRYISTMSGYWFAFLVCCVIAQCLNGLTYSTYFSKTFLENICGFVASFLGLARIIGAPLLIFEWWYMSAAIVFILLVPLFFESSKKYGVLATVGFVILIPRVIGIDFAGGTKPFSFIMPVLLGVIFEQYDLFEVIHKKLSGFSWIGYILSVAGCFLAYKLYRRLPFEQYWEIKYGVVPVMVVICLNETVLNIKWIRSVLVFLGKHSMNMYLVHMMFLLYIKEFLFADRYFLFSWGVLVLLSLGCSIVIEWIKKTVGWNKFVKRLLHS